MRLIEKHIGHPVEWSHYSDESAVLRYRSSSGTIDSAIIRAATDNEIDLVGVPKGPQTVMARVKLIKHLLIKNQLYISAHCSATIQMLNELRKGATGSEYVNRTQRAKHIFDALTYALQMEAADAIQNPRKSPVGSNRIIMA
jgi:hypothetical protein